MSVVENLRAIETVGLRKFVKRERAKWQCRQCGETLCVHRPGCVSCGLAWPKRPLREIIPPSAGMV